MEPVLFFWHFPRTAGTTLNKILANNFEQENILSIYDAQDYKNYRFVEKKFIKNIRLIMGHIMPQSLNPPIIYERPAKIFTFLREPVSRLVSEYIFEKTWPKNHLYSFLNEKSITFREYLQSEEPFLKYRGKNFLAHSLILNFMEMDETELLELAKNSLKENFVMFGIQEYFDASLLLLANTIGLKNLLYEKQNVLRKEQKEGFSLEDLQLASELNSVDMALYAYASDLFQKKIADSDKDFQEQLKKFIFLNNKYQKICGLIEKDKIMQEEGPIIHPK